MELQKEPKRRFRIEKLEDRIAPALGLPTISIGASSVTVGASADVSVLGLVTVGAGVTATASIGAISL